jgi:hypothetical protein
MDPASERVPEATRLLGLVSGSWKSQAAHVAAATGAHPPSLHRLLRALATIELVRELEDGSFEITAMGALLRDGTPDSLRSWVLHWGGPSWPVWGRLFHSVMTGESARSLLSGTEGFEHLERDPEAAEHRCEFVAGDFFEWVPRGADTYVLKSVIHDWDDERAAKVLASCRRAIAPEGRLLVVERTEPELRSLLSAAGFRAAHVSPLRSTLAVIEAVPADDNAA